MDFTTPKQGCLTYFFRQNSHCVGDMHSNQNNKYTIKKLCFLRGFFFVKGGWGVPAYTKGGVMNMSTQRASFI